LRKEDSCEGLIESNRIFRVNGRMDDRMFGIKDRFPHLGKNDRDEMWMQSEPRRRRRMGTPLSLFRFSEECPHTSEGTG